MILQNYIFKNILITSINVTIILLSMVWLVQSLRQIDLIIEIYEIELARFEDLHDYHDGDPGHITGWLENNILRVKTRLEWLNNFKLNVG